jgi:hypothetical protein
MGDDGRSKEACDETAAGDGWQAAAEALDDCGDDGVGALAAGEATGFFAKKPLMSPFRGILAGVVGAHPGRGYHAAFWLSSRGQVSCCAVHRAVLEPVRHGPRCTQRGWGCRRDFSCPAEERKSHDMQDTNAGPRSLTTYVQMPLLRLARQVTAINYLVRSAPGLRTHGLGYSRWSSASASLTHSTQACR